MARLASRIAAQRRFIADAAHQLRTPLAGHQVADRARARRARLPDAGRAALAQLAAGTERSDRAREPAADAGARGHAAGRRRRSDVDLVAAGPRRDRRPSAAAHRARARTSASKVRRRRCACIVRGDALLLREMLSNLVDNALRYTPDGGAITVRVDRDNGTGAVSLAVSDTGPGVPADERDRVFEPFYRGADVEAPGTGLGLAIVRTIAGAHGATVSLAAGEPGGGLARVVHRLPRPRVRLASRKVGVRPAPSLATADGSARTRPEPGSHASAVTGGIAMAPPHRPCRHSLDSRRKRRRVIFASSLGTVFEWYDFYLYATLAPFFAALFFPKGNDTAALLRAFATYAAGFLVRPFGALVFGRIGDLVGRKYTFLVTILVHGLLDVRRRPAADVRVDRLGGARSCSSACGCCRAWHSAASTAVRRRTSRSTRPKASAATTRAGSRPRPRSASSCRCWSSASAASPA